MTLRVLASPAHYRLDPAFGSEYQWALEILRGVEAHGVDVTAITGTFSSDVRAVGSTGRHIDVHGVWAENPTLTHRRRIEFAVRTWREGERQMGKNRFDVLHHILPFAFNRTFNLLAMSKGRDLPFVLGPVQPSLTSDTSDELGVASRSFGSTPKITIADRLLEVANNVPSALSARTVRRADVIIAVSDEAKRVCLEVDPTARVIVASPGVDVAQFRTSTTVAANTEILVSGYLVKRKQVALVIRAAAKLDPSLFTVLRIVGDGPERNNLERLAREMGIADRVVFEGVVPGSEMARYYQRAAVVCFVSTEETVGMAAMETMACGVPLIATATGIVPQLLADPNAGTLVEAEVGDVAAALQRVLSDRELRARQGTVARSRIEHNYGWGRIAKIYLDAYEEAIELRRRNSDYTKVSV